MRVAFLYLIFFGVFMSILSLLSGTGSMHNDQIVLRLANVEMFDEECGIEDHRNDPETAAKWQELTEFYHEMEADQYRELEEYGYLKSYGGRPVTEEGK